jgi:hypothetical protein
MLMRTYPSYENLPSIAGLCSMDDAARPGLSVEEVVRRLKRYHYSFKRLFELLTARIPSEPIYELKMAWSHHSYLCAEHVTALRTRVAEMREPPLGLDATPDEALAIFFDEILAAPSAEELLVAVYEKVFPALKSAMESHLAQTNPLADAPSNRVCRFAILELDEMIAYGKRAIPCLVDQNRRAEISPWLSLLDDCLAAAGQIDGTQAKSTKPLTRKYSAKLFVFDGVPRRDERFKDPYNMGVNAEAFLYDEKMPVNAKTLMMFYKRLREIDVPEMMASILFETKNKPWLFYRDMSRQLWDEARHAMMGEVGFASHGIDWPNKVRINFTWSLQLNTQLTPQDRHAVLFFIEQGLMSKTGKRYEWEVGVASNDPLAALFQDYDWADEVLHASIGRNWYVKDFPTSKEAIAYGDQCWSKVLSAWRDWRDQGLTKHENWWPDLYKEACSHWHINPDPAALAFHETYENARADLKEISASG